MRNLTGVILAVAVILTGSTAIGQPPTRRDDGPRENRSAADESSFITRMMTFDVNGDDKLSKAEITDARLLMLFERADANKDGIVTRDELKTLYKKESANLGRGGFDGGPPGGPGGRGPGGPGGRGGPGMGGPPPIGEVLPGRVREMLNLSSAQLKKIDDLQKQVDTQLDEILNDEQKRQLKELRSRGPGGPPGPGGRPQRPPE